MTTQRRMAQGAFLLSPLRLSHTKERLKPFRGGRRGSLVDSPPLALQRTQVLGEVTCADMWLKRARNLRFPLGRAAGSLGQRACKHCWERTNVLPKVVGTKPLMKTVTGPFMRRRVGYSQGRSESQKPWAVCSREAQNLPHTPRPR